MTDWVEGRCLLDDVPDGPLKLEAETTVEHGLSCLNHPCIL